MHHHIQRCSSKGVLGWQMEELILPTTVLVKVPLLLVRQTEFPIRCGSHRTPNQVG
jgi:hypothetical protein